IVRGVFVTAAVIVPVLNLVCKFLAPALPPHPRTSGSRNALRRLDDAVNNDRSTLVLAQSRRRHKVVVARVLK
ncbi:hypothetical protein EDB83DRAFT_2372863, partial [Lactarius deliciosus]